MEFLGSDGSLGGNAELLMVWNKLIACAVTGPLHDFNLDHTWSVKWSGVIILGPTLSLSR